MRTVHELAVKWKTFCLFHASLGFALTVPAKVCEDNEAVVSTFETRRITLRLRHIVAPLHCTNDKHSKGAFDILAAPSRMQIHSVSVKA